MSQGRDEALIDAALDRGSNRPRVCTVVGPPGIGKSELLRRVRRRWRSEGHDVLRVVGSELEASVPLGVVDQLLGQLGADSASGVTTEAGEENVERRVAGTLLRSLDALTSDPLLVVDDAHWIDETSRRVLDFVLRRLDDEAPATLIAERPGRPLTAVGDRVVLDGLSLAETADLVARTDRDADATVLHELSGGNPLALHELLAAGVDPRDDRGAADRQLIRRRIEQLAEPTRRALALLARRRVGDDVDVAWNVLATVDGAGDAPTLRDATKPASEIGLLDLDDLGRPSFRHPEYRTTANTSVDRPTQRALSSALAATTNDEDSAAWHRADAADGLDDEVSALLAAAGRRSAERGVPIEAARAFEAAAAHAVDPATVVDRRIDAAQCWFFAGEQGEVARVTEGCDTLPVDQLRRIRARQYHRFAVGWLAPADVAIQGFLDDADVAAEFSIDVATGLRLAAFVETLHAGRIDRATEIAALLADALDETAAQTWGGAAALTSAFADLLAGRVVGDHAPAADVLLFAAALDPRKLETPALTLLELAGYAAMMLERWDEARGSLQRLATEERSRGATVMSDFTDASLAELDRRSGRWASAMSRCTDEVEIDPRLLGAGPASQRAIRARMLACRGDSMTLRYAEAVHIEAGRPGMASITGAADVARATHHLVLGEPETAADLMEALDQRSIEGGVLECGVLWYELDAIEAFAATGRSGALTRLVERLEAHAAATARRWSSACAALGRSLIDGSVPPDEVVAQARRLGDAFEAARMELLVVEWASRRGTGIDPHDARVDLVELRNRLARFGAGPFVDRCDAVTASVRSDVADFPASAARTEARLEVLTALTPAELRVAVSVAGGRTNAEAAEELYLSVRTVEAHLRAIFRKLNLRNRVELATVMAGHVSA